MPALASLSQADLDALAAEQAAIDAAAAAAPVPAPYVEGGYAPTDGVSEGYAGDPAAQQYANQGAPPQPAYIPESSAYQVPPPGVDTEVPTPGSSGIQTLPASGPNNWSDGLFGANSAVAAPQYAPVEPGMYSERVPAPDRHPFSKPEGFQRGGVGGGGGPGNIPSTSRDQSNAMTPQVDDLGLGYRRGGVSEGYWGDPAAQQEAERRRTGRSDFSGREPARTYIPMLDERIANDRRVAEFQAVPNPMAVSPPITESATPYPAQSYAYESARNQGAFTPPTDVPPPSLTVNPQAVSPARPGELPISFHRMGLAGNAPATGQPVSDIRTLPAPSTAPIDRLGPWLEQQAGEVIPRVADALGRSYGWGSRLGQSATDMQDIVGGMVLEDPSKPLTRTGQQGREAGRAINAVIDPMAEALLNQVRSAVIAGTPGAGGAPDKVTTGGGLRAAPETAAVPPPPKTPTLPGDNPQARQLRDFGRDGAGVTPTTNASMFPSNLDAVDQAIRGISGTIGLEPNYGWGVGDGTIPTPGSATPQPAPSQGTDFPATRAAIAKQTWRPVDVPKRLGTVDVPLIGDGSDADGGNAIGVRGPDGTIIPLDPNLTRDQLLAEIAKVYPDVMSGTPTTTESIPEPAGTLAPGESSDRHPQKLQPTGTTSSGTRGGGWVDYPSRGGYSGGSSGSSRGGYSGDTRSSRGGSDFSTEDAEDRDFTADDFMEQAGGNRVKAKMMANMANARKRRGRLRGVPRQQSGMRDDILRAIQESLSKPKPGR